MSRRKVFSKPLSKEGQDNFDRIFGSKNKEPEPEASVEVLADGPGGYADSRSVPPIK